MRFFNALKTVQRHDQYKVCHYIKAEKMCLISLLVVKNIYNAFYFNSEFIIN